MNTYFARHTIEIDIDGDTRASLWDQRKVAIHFPDALVQWPEEDTTSLDLIDYVGCRGMRAMKALVELAQSGGYVCADHYPHKEVLVGVVEPGTPIEAVSDVGGGASIWTRKQGAVRFVGTVTLDGEEIAVDELGCVDESAGYHARRTDWEWSAGVGSLADGRAVGWNLVRGIHDGETGSERYVWVEGSEPVEVGPVVFAADLSSVGGLSFEAEATRARRDDLGVFRSDYVQPFGTFTGTLPGGLELAGGRGVMERHSALW
mgnify:CR=1 FL=1